MGTPYIGEIRMFAGNFAPRGYAFCDGRILAISQYDVVFNLIGTTYGGDGQTTFALPNLQGRMPMHQGTGAGLSTRVIGQMSGSETVTLTLNQLPQHTHVALGSGTDGNGLSPEGNVWAAGAGGANAYNNTAPNTPMTAQASGQAGGNQPHDNMSPFLAINFIFALEGIFPSPS